VNFFLKLLLKAGVTLAVMFIGYKYILTGGFGGFQIPGMADIKGKASDGISNIENAVVEKDVTVYQWVDADGITHYGGTQPTGAGSYTKKQIHANTNVINAIKTAEEKEEESQKSRVSRVGSVYSPEGVKDLMKDAEGVNDIMENRVSEQEKILNEILGEPGSKK
jgi:Domain of unknown function (DUF4124)